MDLFVLNSNPKIDICLHTSEWFVPTFYGHNKRIKNCLKVKYGECRIVKLRLTSYEQIVMNAKSITNLYPFSAA